MDIFVRNIPDQSSNKSLETFFRNNFRSFGIHEFTCWKLKSRGCAILTVVDAGKARQFLNVHGGRSQSGGRHSHIQGLKYINRDLFCTPSRFEPDEIVLETLRKQAKDKGNQTDRKNPAAELAEHLDREFKYSSLRCGLWDYQASNLVFVSEYSDTRMGCIKFGRKNLALVALVDGIDTGPYRLDIPYSSVQSITTGSFQNPSVTLTLSEAPKVYQESTSDANSFQTLFGALSLQWMAPTKSKLIRVASLGGAHESVIAGCLVYRVLISKPSEIQKIDLLLRQGRSMPASIPWPTSISAPKSLYSNDLDQLIAALRNQRSLLDFRVRFQVQRLAQNVYLSPGRVLELLPHVLQISLRSGGLIGAEAVRKLSRRLPFAGPDTDGKVFATENLRTLLSEGEQATIRELSHDFRTKRQHPEICLVHKAIVTPQVSTLEDQNQKQKIGYCEPMQIIQTISFASPSLMKTVSGCALTGLCP